MTTATIETKVDSVGKLLHKLAQPMQIVSGAASMIKLMTDDPEAKARAQDILDAMDRVTSIMDKGRRSLVKDNLNK